MWRDSISINDVRSGAHPKVGLRRSSRVSQIKTDKCCLRTMKTLRISKSKGLARVDRLTDPTRENEREGCKANGRGTRTKLSRRNARSLMKEKISEEEIDELSSPWTMRSVSTCPQDKLSTS